MDLDRLRYFVTAVESGGLRHASEILKISPAGVSKAIKQLERDFNQKLILPSGRGIKITDHGKWLAAKGRSILNEISSLRSEFDMGHPLEESLRIGSFDCFTSFFISSYVASHFPSVSTIVYNTTSTSPQNLLLRDMIDFAISFEKIQHSELECLPITKVSQSVYGCANTFKNSNFEEYPFVVPTIPVDHSPSRTLGLDGWPDQKISRRIRHRVPTVETALDYCRRGLAVGYFPDFVVDLHNDLVNKDSRLEALPFPSLATHSELTSTYLSYRKQDSKNRFCEPLIRSLKSLSGES